MSTLRTELRLAEALAHRELGDRSRARVELTALADEAAETTLSWRLLAGLELARMHLDEGELAAAAEALDRAEALMDAEGFDGRGWLARVGVLLALASGDLDTARAWAESDRDVFWHGVSSARILLVTGDRPGAVAALETAVPRGPRHDVVLGLLGARSVVAPDEAAKLATSAVEVAARHGLLQTVASEGPDAIELVEHAAWRAPAGWMDRLRRTAAATRSGPRLDRYDLVEPLTDRELAVLRLLPSRLTVREIADELYVSMNTVKFHLRVIYRKLGVNSRAEAAELARRTTFTRR
jgi:LuxR family maltose regulon positive regulatory protein